MSKQIIKLLGVGLVLVISLSFITTVIAQETKTEDEPRQTTTVLQPGDEVNLDEEVKARDLEVPEPKVLPGSPFYFLKKWSRRIRSVFTFNPVKKAELRLRFASERLLEAKKLAEKAKNPEIIKRAAENYEKEVNKINSIVNNIKDKAAQNPKVGKFLDKFIRHQVLHQKILERLQEKVPPEALKKIKRAKERHIQRFGEVMQKLEDKTKIGERLQKNLQVLRGSKFKSFKNLQILKELEEKAPQAAKQGIRTARENILRRFKEKFEQMSTTTQERFKDYIEKVRGEAAKKMEIIEDIKSELKERPEIQKRLKRIRAKILERIPKRQKKIGCPEIKKPGPGFCAQGRIIPERDKKGCITSFRCLIPGEETFRPIVPQKPVPGTQKRACITLWDPVCGKDGRTYSNKCFAEVAGVKIEYKGVCKEKTAPRKIPLRKIIPPSLSE